ncbi:antigen 5 like allergen Cul n 1-like [Uranotaenia lowii]|uniref:antigen 5 like allergen Cul n 1-like n=1 Tax=Uranotaenia lowii TaxID=190385 RepID=UPI00247A0B5B|nr:antigen 5 like allergen Cul n 1-like [Uranotaenia lowii]
MLRYLLVLLVVQWCQTLGFGTDYCRKDICPGNSTHVACQAPKQFGPSCFNKKPKVIRMRKTMKKVLLQEHNRLRSLVAEGKLTGFPPASRMPTLVWDVELQHIAGCNTRLCRFEHDSCRNTNVFRYAGQNLAMRTSRGPLQIPVPVNRMLRDFVRSWFAEHKATRPAMIDAYPENYDGPDIGHFTQLVSDRTWKMGCALVRFNDAGSIRYYLVCNYSFINIIGQPVYRKGPSCSRCQRKCNKKYPGLCKISEKVLSVP